MSSITVPSALLKHRKEIGTAIHLYLLYLSMQQSGQEYSDYKAARKLGAPLSTIRSWRKKLQDAGYMPVQSTAGYVYLIGAGNGLMKIGVTTNNPKERLETLQTGSPVPLTLIHYIETSDAYQLESELHQRFASVRKHGEWFALTPDNVSFITSL